MAVLCLLIAFAIQGSLASQSRIIHGIPTTPHEFPHHVAIYIKRFPYTPEYFFCSGSIITPEWILTAGNCVPKIGQLSVKAGKHYIDIKESYEQVRGVSEYIIHEKFAGSILPTNSIPKNDIALLQLESPLIINNYVKPIALPSSNNINDNFGDFCSWSSYVNELFPNYPLNTELQAIEMEIVNNDICLDELNLRRLDIESYKTQIAQGQLCTRYNELGGGPCFYDTGSGFIQNNKHNSGNSTAQIVGIFSWTKLPCGRYGKPAIFTRVSFYKDWIKTHIKYI